MKIPQTVLLLVISTILCMLYELKIRKTISINGHDEYKLLDWCLTS